ncbi:MAG TPA: acyloxyacyl hydrolase [Terriglobales bacterium]|nr:acyloxyacyl hydrolase [Terriglobales bacterium]
MAKSPIALVAVLYISAYAQNLPSGSLEKGTWELAIWTAGGHSVSGGTSETSVWNAGLRLGRVLTHDHGSGFSRGNLEYAGDVVPIYVLFFPRQTSYAGGFNPVILKWNFTSGQKVAPYFEFGGGVLLSLDDVPPGTSKVNFTPQASFGVQIFGRGKRAVSLAGKYVHISNAGLATPNPGINTLQFAIGYQCFK